MPVELKVPRVGESISEVEIAEWSVGEGDSIERDATIATLDSAKTTVELPSPVSGTLLKIVKQVGETAAVGEVIALIEEGAAKARKPAAGADKQQSPKPAEATQPVEAAKPRPAQSQAVAAPRVMPAAKRELAQNGLEASQVEPTGPGGRLLKEDAQRAGPEQAVTPSTAAPATPTDAARAPATANEGEEVVRMTVLRRHIAQRLVEAQQSAALLTTFNEIDMAPVMALRKEHQDAFTKRYGVKIGFMSFFVKAAIDALKQYPAINAEIRGNDVVYRNYYDIGVAIGGGKGLVVPVLRHAESLSFAEIEKAIGGLAKRARENALLPDELEGGTFTITNGGIYGSLLSTPIVNPPQSGILGMHAINDRPIAHQGQVVIRPMMYVALTYDHRIVDGREAVGFLVRIKECIENPTRMLIEV